MTMPPGNGGVPGYSGGTPVRPKGRPINVKHDARCVIFKLEGQKEKTGGTVLDL